MMLSHLKLAIERDGPLRPRRRSLGPGPGWYRASMQKLKTGRAIRTTRRGPTRCETGRAQPKRHGMQPNLLGTSSMTRG